MNDFDQIAHLVSLMANSLNDSEITGWMSMMVPNHYTAINYVPRGSHRSTDYSLELFSAPGFTDLKDEWINSIPPSCSYPIYYGDIEE